ncbi:unnamed protein product (macronuclear) [Paramecium tetraurelia]|uniref:TNFR-Cys domain-containing protein n=1 Tax=Paramecium tetraurelia TaxID=5888 RepID=A0D4G9_PARTE|nr:uncharacterized protein GSPATT00013402001 [Paramecium tetraurelia]CAK77936.1 unnamed protein product [Paramecium tetraurelia]|eukprot:XP_001445333.1 hypothetical protein (macronuclear) [Paramecium tetraurelia strain d4-2]
MLYIFLIWSKLLEVGTCATIVSTTFFKATLSTNPDVTTLKLNTEYLIKFEFTLPTSPNSSTDYFKIIVAGFAALRSPDYSKCFKDSTAVGVGSKDIQFSFDKTEHPPFIMFYATTGASLVEHTCQGFSLVKSTDIIIDQSDKKTFTLTGGTITIDSISPSNRIFNLKSTYTIRLTFENPLSSTNQLTFTKPSALQSGTPIICSGNPSSGIQCSYDSLNELIIITTLDSTKTQVISLDFTNPQAPTTFLTFNNFITKIDNVVDTSSTSLVVNGYNDGILTDIQIDSGSYKVGSSAFIKYTFKNINDIELNSEIELTLPSDIKWDLSSKSCSLSVAGVLKVCDYVQSSTDAQVITVTITISNSIPGGTSIILTINSIITPNTFKSATGFSFKIIKNTVEYDKKIAFGSLTNTQQSGISLTNLARSETKNGAQSTYTFDTTFETEQPVGTKITFTLPGFLLGNVNKVEFSDFSPYTGSNLIVISSAATITIQLNGVVNKNQICVTKIYNVVNKDSIGTITAETVLGTYKISSTTQGTALIVPSGDPNTITIDFMNIEKKLLGVLDTYYFKATLFNIPSAGSTIIVTMPENFSVDVGNKECKAAMDRLAGLTVDTCQVNNQEISIKTSAISSKNIEFRLNNLIRNPKVSQSTYFFQLRTQGDTTIIDKSSSSDSLLQFKLNCPATPSVFCKECDNSDNCLSCYTDVSITTNIYLLDQKCISTCGQKYYSDSSNACKTCPDNCLECTSSTVCQSCTDDTNYELKNSKCVKKCTEKQFDFNGICTPCNENCNTCVDQSTKCTSCGTTNNLLYQNKCVSQCPTGIFQVGFSCIACTSPCKTCSTGPTACLTCVNNYYYKKTSLSCVTDCGNRYFQDGSDCTQCTEPCNNCSSSTICIDCITGYYLFNNSCISTVPNGYYKSGTSLIKCPNICGNCISETECTSCPTNQYLLSKQCIDKCPDKYYSLNFVCYSCDASCLLCSSSTVCTLCPDNYLHLSGKCYQNCPTKYYSLEQQCLSCQSSCATCANGLECKTCPTSSPYMSSNLCVSTCLANYYIKEFACVKCSNECATCDEKGCLTCIENYKYLNQTCVTSCPSGYQDLNNVGICDKLTSSEEQLISNLQENKYIPIPFTIVSIIMILSVAVAKISKSETFIPGSAVGLLGLIIVGSWAVLLILQLDYILEKLEMYLLMSSIGVHIILNLINLCVIKHSTKGDIAFNQWYAARKSNSCAYIFLNVLSLLSFTMTRFYFSRYFGFRFLKCRLSDVENMVGMNIINGLCAFFCCIPALIASVLLAYRDQQREQLFISSIDSFIVTIVFAICLICETQKEENFFEENNNVTAPHSLQVVPDYFQTKRSKRFSFDESINGQQFNKNEQDHEPSFPKIDESIEYKDNQSFQNMMHSQMIYKQEIPDPKKDNFNLSQEDMIIKIQSNDVSEPISVIESSREYQNKIQEQKKLEELQRQEELKRIESERLAELKRIEDEIKQQELEKARREKELLQLEEQKKQQELLIQQQQEAMRLERTKEEQRQAELAEQEERRIAELKRIEEQLQAEKLRQEELKLKQQEDDQRRLEEEQQKKREDEIKQLLEEQQLQAQKEQELLQSKLNKIILVDQDDDDVGWNMEDEENQEQSIDQGYQQQIQKEIILDENNDAEDNWDVPTSRFVSIQPKSHLKKDKQIEEPQNPFRGENQRYAAQSDLLKFSSDDEEDWAKNQISPSEFNVLNQRFNQNDHSATQVDRSNMFSSTGQNFTSLTKRPTQPDPQIISDDDSINQSEQFPKIKQTKGSKKQNKGQHKKMQSQRQKIQQKGKQNITTNDIQF